MLASILTPAANSRDRSGMDRGKQQDKRAIITGTRGIEIGGVRRVSGTWPGKHVEMRNWANSACHGLDGDASPVDVHKIPPALIDADARGWLRVGTKISHRPTS